MDALGCSRHRRRRKSRSNVCFRTFTSFSGVRACDAARPCRDDYICVQPMAEKAEDASGIFDKRLASLNDEPFFRNVLGKPYKAENYFGQTRPDNAWLDRNDRRGICIPPYFVFQFRSDNHPAPPED